MTVSVPEPARAVSVMVSCRSDLEVSWGCACADEINDVGVITIPADEFVYTSATIEDVIASIAGDDICQRALPVPLI